MMEVISWPLKKYEDERGWLCELFRTDEGFRPEMGYVSMTLPGVSRGPHEHVHQTDLFFFMGKFKVYLWHKGARETRILDHTALIVPPGVVHAYKNIGEAALVYNFPDKLYKGPGRKDPVDEIRHEDDPNTIYVLD